MYVGIADRNINVYTIVKNNSHMNEMFNKRK